MNEIILKGLIQDIEDSHVIGDIQYSKANLIVQRDSRIDDIISLRFKKFSNKYKEGQEIDLIGNIRSYSRQINEDKNKVDIYVFTYFDRPEEDELNETNNEFIIDGRICKMEGLRKLPGGKQNIHFIVANNLEVTGSQKLNSYLPCIAWGKVAKDIAANFKTNDTVHIRGRLQSREYKKHLSDDDYEIRIAHELYVQSILKTK